MVSQVIDTLNEMFLGGSESPAVEKVSLGQQRAVEHIAQCCSEMGKPPEGLTAEDALRALQADSGYEGDPLTLEPLCVDRLSLPRAGSRPIPLSSLL